MALEIEKRFLIKNNNWEKYIVSKSYIEQGYFNSNDDGWIIRIRYENKKYKITFKKHIVNSSCLEFEYEIPTNDGEPILSSLTNRIRKERFYLDINNKDWIVDRFKGENFPLEIAEVELNDDKEKIHIPSFLSKEITGLKIFSNFQLSKKSFSKWSEQELKNLITH